MKPRQLGGDGLFDLGERSARRRGSDDLKEAPELARPLRRRDLGRDALLVDQAAIQPRRLSAGQHLGHQIQLGVVFGEERRRMPREVEPRQLDAVFENEARLAGRAWP